MLPRRRRALPDSAAVQNAGEAAETVEDVLAVRVPPGDGDASGIPVGELQLRALVQPVLRVRAAEAGFFVPAPGRLSRGVRILEVVRPHRARLQPGRDPGGALPIARPHARAQPERRVVRQLHRLPLVAKRLDGDDGPEDLLLRQRGIAADAGEDGRLVEPAGERNVGSAASGRRARSAVQSVGDEALDLHPLLLGDERPDLGPEIAAGPDPKTSGSTAQLLDEGLVQVARDVDPLDARAGLATVRERAPQGSLDGTVEIRVLEDEHG